LRQGVQVPHFFRPEGDPPVSSDDWGPVL